MIYPDSTVAVGQVYSASDNTPFYFGDGCIFTNCTFINPCNFGDGCIFIGCVLVDAYPSTKNTQPHKTGVGCVFDKGTMINYTIIGQANVFGDGFPIGFRPNVPGMDMVATPDTEHSDGVHSVRTGCATEKGHLVVVQNGLKYDGPVQDCTDEKKGGPSVRSSGTCGEGCD